MGADLGDELSSPLLRELTTPGAGFPDMEAALRDMQEATNWEEAESSGRVVPQREVRWHEGLRWLWLGWAACGLQEKKEQSWGRLGGCRGGGGAKLLLSQCAPPAAQGVDAAYDEARGAIQVAEADLEEYLQVGRGGW